MLFIKQITEATVGAEIDSYLNEKGSINRCYAKSKKINKSVNGNFVLLIPS